MKLPVAPMYHGEENIREKRDMKLPASKHHHQCHAGHLELHLPCHSVPQDKDILYVFILSERSLYFGTGYEGCRLKHAAPTHRGKPPPPPTRFERFFAPMVSWAPVKCF